MAGFGDDVYHFRSLCRLERGDGYHRQFDYIASACCPAVLEDTYDGACESLISKV